jgi:hypothetical protein
MLVSLLMFGEEVAAKAKRDLTVENNFIQRLLLLQKNDRTGS